MLTTLNRWAAFLIASLAGTIGAVALVQSLQVAGLVLALTAPTLVIAIHELGHALAAWGLGMHVSSICVGPLVLHTAPLRLTFGDRLFGRDVGGYVQVDEARGRYLTRRTNALITLAGPLANLLSVVAAFATAQLFGGGLAALLLGAFGFLSFSAFVASAWPLRLASGLPNDALIFLRDIRPSRIRPRPAKRSPWQAR